MFKNVSRFSVRRQAKNSKKSEKYQSRNKQSGNEELIWKRIRPMRGTKKRSKWILGVGLLTGGFLFFKGMDKLNDSLDQFYAPNEKEKLVVLGSGWAAISLLKTINTHKYDVTVVSPNNYFLFTPLLHRVALGTISVESITEPVRRFAHGSGFTFYEAEATDIDIKNKTVSCKSKIDQSNPFSLEYDKLVVAIGGVSNSLNVKGSDQYSLKLRDIEGSIKIRNKLIDCIELASLPGISEEEKKKLLSFVLVGGSPMASEFAANIHDYLKKNIDDTHPHLSKYFKITVVRTKDHVHNYYDQSISHTLKQYFKRDNIEYEYGDVVELNKDTIIIKDQDGKVNPVSFGMCVWATGTSINPLVDALRRKIDDQPNERALLTDMSLRVQGVDDIFAIGDCATIDQKALLNKWSDVFKKADINKDGTIDLEEFHSLVNDLSRTYPALRALNSSTFEEFDINKDNVLSTDEFKLLLGKMERTLTRFPLTAAVAAQQGDFLAWNLNKGSYDPNEDKKDDKEEDGPVFRYKHIGGYEYVGAEDGFVERGSRGSAIVTGPGAFWMWRAVYFSRIVSKGIRFKVFYEWIHSWIFKDQGTRI